MKPIISSNLNNLDLLIFLGILTVLFAVWNGLVIRWKQAPQVEQPRWSNLWHGVAAIIHVIIILLCAYLYKWWGLAVGLFVNWILYNIIIAKFLRQKWYYVGTTSRVDRIIRKLLPFINFDR